MAGQRSNPEQVLKTINYQLKTSLCYNTPMQKNKTVTIITTLLLIIIGGYLYKTQNQITEEKVDTTTEASVKIDGSQIETSVQKNDSVQEVFLSYDKDGNLTIVPETNPQKDLPPMPNLDREIIFNTDFPTDQKEKTTQKIKDIIARLKGNSSSVDDWMSLGANRKMIEDYEGAIESWKYASALIPLNIVPLNNLGNLYHYQLKDYSKAEENFRKAISVGPSYINSYSNLFDLYSLSYKQETNNAENILLEGLENNLDNINLLMILAAYYEDKGNSEKAVIYYQKTAEQAKVLGNMDLYDQIQTQISALK